jgi:hypothetical protein
MSSDHSQERQDGILDRITLGTLVEYVEGNIDAGTMDGIKATALGSQLGDHG